MSEMTMPSTGSTVAFLLVIVFVAITFVIGVWRGGESDQTSANRKRWAVYALIGTLAWLAFGAIVPISKLLELDMLPPPAMFFIAICMLTMFALAFSSFGTRLTKLPLAALVGVQAFRLSLEMVLHKWYEQGTMPVQMTWSGHNFDVASGILAIAIGAWALTGKAPRWAIWFFNIVGSLLLCVVMSIAIMSTPIPIRQYMNDPPVLLAFHFPYSWIVSIAVSGALMWHIVLFRRLLTRDA